MHTLLKSREPPSPAPSTPIKSSFRLKAKKWTQITQLQLPPPALKGYWKPVTALHPHPTE